MTGDGSIGDYQGGGGDASFGGGPADVGGGGGDYNSAALADLAAASGFSPNVSSAVSLADLAAASQGMTLADRAAVDLAGIGGREHSPGLSYADLAALEQAGFGKMDIPGFSQNIEQALAAQNVHNVLNYAVPALAGLVPGYSTVSALGKGIANIHGLMTGRLTPAEVMPGLAAGLIGAKTGIPSGLLEGVFAGDLGKAAGAGAQAGLGALASNFGGPVGSLAYGLSGLGSAVNRGVSEAVSGATGGARSSGLGSFSGAGPAPSASTASTGSAYGDAGITQEISPTRAAIEQAVRETSTPAWDRQIVAGRYGPTMQYEYGA
jgi:hypothetical protein